MSAATLILAAAAQAAQPSIDGLWKNPAGTVIIAIGPCGQSRCGTVKWASPAAIADAAKGTSTLVGSDLLTGLKPRGQNSWQGRLFVPDERIRAQAKLQLLGDNQLKVSGCALGGAVCKSQLWTRADEPLPPSD